METRIGLIDPIALQRHSTQGLQVQLAASLKERIQAGELRADTRLPSTRALAEELGLSRNTVVAAYALLEEEGYLRAHDRSGFAVGSAARTFASSPMRPRPGARETAAIRTPAGPVPFRPAQPDVRLFSLKTWNRHRTRVLRGGTSLLGYQSRFSLGLDELRRAVAAYLRGSRNVRCDWREIAITNGSQQALYLLGQLLLGPGSAAYMEDPGYPGARMSWLEAQATVVPVPVDEEGLCLPLPDVPRAALVYCTPSHQFPLGTCMSLARRLALLQVARERELWLIEDDYDAEFRYSSAPQPSLQGLDGNLNDKGRRVIYLGSFSKTLFPGLRLGYAVLPPALVEPFERLKSTVDDHGPLLDQATLAGFMESGAFLSHLRRCRRVYAARQELFLSLVRRAGLPLTFPVTGRGMNLAGHLPPGTDDTRWAAALEGSGLDIPPLSRYGGEARGFLFGLTAFDEPTIRDGVRRLEALPWGSL